MKELFLFLWKIFSEMVAWFNEVLQNNEFIKILYQVTLKEVVTIFLRKISDFMKKLFCKEKADICDTEASK